MTPGEPRVSIRSLAEPTERFFRLRIAYRGTRFHGWQYQDSVRTVEGELRRAVARLSPELSETIGASRTDTGVHALDQVVRVRMITRLDEAELRKALASLTPDDMDVLDCRQVSPEFSPRDALAKRYVYRIVNRPGPPLFSGDTVWWLRRSLDVAAMDRAFSLVVGRHDFASFQNRSKDPPESSIRTIHHAAWRRFGERVEFEVVGDGFLYRMVRNLVGTGVEIGRGRWPGARLTEILEAGDRRAAGPSAPPEGLVLHRIRYPGEPPLDPRPEPLELL